jgi:hypothetical protein
MSWKAFVLSATIRLAGLSPNRPTSTAGPGPTTPRSPALWWTSTATPPADRPRRAWRRGEGVRPPATLVHEDRPARLIGKATA